MENRQIVIYLRQITFLLIASMAIQSIGYAQEVIISSDIIIKNEKKYVVLGKMKEHILLFRDRINQQEIDVLDTNLKLKYTREVKLNRKNHRIIAVQPHGEAASIIFTHLEDDTLSIHQHLINHLGEMQDTIELGRYHKKQFKSNFKYAFSDNEKKLLVFNEGKDNRMNLFLIDLDLQKIKWETSIQEPIKALDFKFQDMIVTNEEHVIILYERGNHRSISNKHAMKITHFSEGMTIPSEIEIEMPEYLSKDIHLAYDELNDRLMVIGLFTEYNRSSALGYFYFTQELDAFTTSADVYFQQFDEPFINKVNGKRRGMNNTLDYYFIKDVIFQRDGSFIWIGEMYKEYVRRSPSPYGSSSGLSGFLDYYTEDVIIINVDQTNQELWKNVIYKKQFSQDDEAIYSSFAVMKNPSRLQLIFNDEIKKNNTVSSYALDPIGNMQRETVLNTEYENLHLRFVDAEQISENSMLVVSEGSGLLNLVKITF